MRSLTWLLFAAASLMAVAEVTLGNNVTVDSIDLAGHHDTAQQRLVRRGLKEKQVLLGRYEITRFFQQTGPDCLGKVDVAAAIDRRSGETVVLKVAKVKNSLLRAFTGNYCGQHFQWKKKEQHREFKQQRIRRMENEIEKAKMLRGMAHSLQLLDSFNEGGYVVAVYPFMNRGDLYNLMDNYNNGQVFVTVNLPTRDDHGNALTPRKSQRHVFPEDVAKKIITEVIKGVKELHDKHLVHLDIKPDNVYAHVSDALVIRLADFDTVAQFAPGKPLVLEAARGTVGYASPEMIRFHDYPNYPGHKNFQHPTSLDMFSVGRLFQRMLFGVSDEAYLFNVNHQFASPEDLSNIYDTMPVVSADAIELIQRLTHPDPAARPSADALLNHRYFAQPNLAKQFVSVPVQLQANPGTPLAASPIPSPRAEVRNDRPLARKHRLRKFSDNVISSRRARKSSAGNPLGIISAPQEPAQPVEPAVAPQNAQPAAPHPFRRSRSSEDLLTLTDQNPQRRDSLLQFHATANRLSNSNKGINQELESNPKVALLRERFEELIRQNEASVRGQNRQLPIQVAPRVPIRT